MNVKEIKELVDLVARRGLAGLEVERAGFRLRIEGPRQDHARPALHSAVYHLADQGEPVPMALPAQPAPNPAQAAASTAARPKAAEEGLVVVTSPIVGTFYRSPNPDAEPFVKT